MAIGIIILLLAAYTTNSIGIHPVFGAFIAGVILPRNVAFTAHVRSLDQVNNLLFLPLFFVSSGLRTQIGLIHQVSLWLICLLLFLIACVGKILGGTLSVRVMGQSWREALVVGILMNTRGLVELIVINIGFQLGILSPTLFTMLVIMAICTTMMASPLLPLLGYRSDAINREDAINRVITNGGDDSPWINPGASRKSRTECTRLRQFREGSVRADGRFNLSRRLVGSRPTSSIGTPNVLDVSAFTRGNDVPRNLQTLLSCLCTIKKYSIGVNRQMFMKGYK